MINPCHRDGFCVCCLCLLLDCTAFQNPNLRDILTIGTIAFIVRAVLSRSCSFNAMGHAQPRKNGLTNNPIHCIDEPTRAILMKPSWNTIRAGEYKKELMYFYFILTDLLKDRAIAAFKKSAVHYDCPPIAGPTKVNEVANFFPNHSA